LSKKKRLSQFSTKILLFSKLLTKITQNLHKGRTHNSPRVFVILQCSYPVWEDFSAKATKLHSQLR